MQGFLMLLYLTSLVLTSCMKTQTAFLTVPGWALPTGGRPLPAVQAIDHRGECARDCASLPALRALHWGGTWEGNAWYQRSSDKFVMCRGGVARSSRGLLRLLSRWSRRMPTWTGTHTLACLATTLPSCAWQVQEQQVSY